MDALLSFIVRFCHYYRFWGCEKTDFSLQPILMINTSKEHLMTVVFIVSVPQNHTYLYPSFSLFPVSKHVAVQLKGIPPPHLMRC